MIKNTVLALFAVASISAVALPVYATESQHDNVGAFGPGDNDAQDWVASTVLTRLQQQGINATSVEDWGGLVRAYVTLEDGTEVMQFFTPDTLQPAKI